MRLCCFAAALTKRNISKWGLWQTWTGVTFVQYILYYFLGQGLLLSLRGIVLPVFR